MGKRRRVAAGHEDILSDYECKDQMDIFDFIEPRPEDLPMKDYLTRLGFKNEYFERPDHECEVEVADIHEYPKLHFFNARYKRNPISGIFCQEYPHQCGYECHWWREIKICEFSKHTCNKRELWKVADTLDEINCPHVCCRVCDTRSCGARCNGSEEPEKLDPDFPIRDKEGWRSFSDKPETFLDFEELELQVLGKYRMNNKDLWSLCPAHFDGSRIIPLEVPFDIPRPDWKYWRVRPDKGISHDRYGREYKAPTWMDAKRCETCKFWELLPVADQPPSGWGVMGQCNCYHEPEMMKNGYWKTSKTSCCMDYKEKDNEQETVGETS